MTVRRVNGRSVAGCGRAGPHTHWEPTERLGRPLGRRYRVWDRPQLLGVVKVQAVRKQQQGFRATACLADSSAQLQTHSPRNPLQTLFECISSNKAHKKQSEWADSKQLAIDRLG